MIGGKRNKKKYSGSNVRIGFTVWLILFIINPSTIPKIIMKKDESKKSLKQRKGEKSKNWQKGEQG